MRADPAFDQNAGEHDQAEAQRCREREGQFAPFDQDELQAIRPSFVSDTPLFYYILKEAQLREDGLRLGPVGARIVAEVFVGLLQLDPDSYLTVEPDWLPTLPTHDGTPQSFGMIDFLTFAGVDPTSRGE